jgi:hypothetical protein
MRLNMTITLDVVQELTGASGVLTAFIIRAINDDGRSKHLVNVGKNLRDYIAQHPRGQSLHLPR